MVQLVAKVEDEIAAEIDRLVANGVFESRSHVVRISLEELLDRSRRDEIAKRILAGYERVPETDEELEHARLMATAMIAEEPW